MATARRRHTPATTPNVPATERQIAFLRSLVTERDTHPGMTVTDATAALDTLITAGLTQTTASTLISEYRVAPRRVDSTQPGPRWMSRPASPATLNALRDIARRRAMFGDQRTLADTITLVEERIAAGLTQGDASALLSAAHRSPAHRSPDDPVFLSDLDLPRPAEGYYALETDTAVRFYRVWTPTSGRYARRTVIARFTSDRTDPLYPQDAATVVTAINADPITAASRFARLQVRCHVCGKRLTDHVSRILLQGPECRGFTPTGLYRPLRSLPDTEENQLRFTEFLRACSNAAPGTDTPPSTQEAAARAAAWFAALPPTLPLTDAITRLSHLTNAGYSPDDAHTNPSLWTVDEQRLATIAHLNL